MRVVKSVNPLRGQRGGGAVWPSIIMLYPQTSLPPLAQEPKAQAHCMTVGDQIPSHVFAQQMGRSHAPSPCRPHHGHPPQNQRIPLLCMTDHSSGGGGSRGGGGGGRGVTPHSRRSGTKAIRTAGMAQPHRPLLVNAPHWTSGWKCLWRAHSVTENRPSLSLPLGPPPPPAAAQKAWT